VVRKYKATTAHRESFGAARRRALARLRKGLTVLALAWYKDDVSAGMKFFGVALTLEAKNRRRR
jgi:hypothetical protein